MIVNFGEIHDFVGQLVSAYDGCRDPYSLLKQLNVILIPRETEIPVSEFKAFYLYTNRQHVVMYNERLHGRALTITLGHELGHRVFFQEQRNAMQLMDGRLYNTKDRPEIIANAFCAELLLTDDQVMDAIRATNMFHKAAWLLKVPEPLLDLKLQNMEFRGFPHTVPHCTVSDCMADEDFLTPFLNMED